MSPTVARKWPNKPHLKNCWDRTLFIPEAPEVRAYLAGLVDGEGSFYLRSQGLNWHFGLGNTNREVIEWCAAFGGKFNTREQEDWRKNQVFEWKVARRLDMLALIEAVEPYLIVKRDVANKAYHAILERRI